MVDGINPGRQHQSIDLKETPNGHRRQQTQPDPVSLTKRNLWFMEPDGSHDGESAQHQDDPYRGSGETYPKPEPNLGKQGHQRKTYSRRFYKQGEQPGLARGEPQVDRQPGNK